MKRDKLFEIFEDYPKLVRAFSEKKDGDLKLGDSPEETARENREKFFRKLGLDSNSVITNGLVQADKVQVVRKKQRGGILPETDGSITAEKGIFLSVTAADCLPVFFYDPKKEIVAIAHAGWRGLAKGILPRVVQKMKEEFSCRPFDILVGIGPGIGECHYEVKPDVIEHFQDFPMAVHKQSEKLFLDLKKIAAIQMRGVGVLDKNIETHQACTYCEKETYFSWRRDKAEIENVQAMLGVIGMRNV